jgi:hypothetical protein
MVNVTLNDSSNVILVDPVNITLIEENSTVSLVEIVEEAKP